MTVKYILLWLILAIIAIINGILRETTYGKFLSDLSANQISTVTGILFIGIFIYFIHRIWPIKSKNQAWIIGFSWLFLTVAFEFIFGHFVAGHSWSRLLFEYNVFAGRLWILFLTWITLLPYIVYKVIQKEA
jgi:hypothetical protein